MELKNKNSLKNNILANINSPVMSSTMPTTSNNNNNQQQQHQRLAPAATGNSKYSKQIKQMQDKINKLESDITKIEQKNKPKLSFGKITSKTFKNIGFKSKTIAKKFAILSDVKIKDYTNEQVFLKALHNKLNNFQKLGLDFNDTVKKFDTSSSKVKHNRNVKIIKKNEKLKSKIEKFILSKKVPYEFDNDKLYKFYVLPTEQLLNDASSHYLVLKNYRRGTNKDYIQKEQTVAHDRKKTFIYDFDGNILTLATYLNDIYNQQSIHLNCLFNFPIC